MPKVSVIVPVYNVAAYLDKCIESLCNQTIEDIEIILVDDGSKDESGVMCDEYAKMDARIKVIHKSNGGLSDARNAGLDICQGEYIGFVDSDDCVEKEMYEVLYDRAIKFNADVSGCMLNYIYNDKVIAGDGKNFTSNDKICIIKFIFEGYGGQISVCNKIFKKDIFDCLRFDVGKYYEDAYFVLKWIEKASCFTCINHGYYNYFYRTDSITTEKFSKKAWDIVEAYKYNLGVIKEKYPKAQYYAERRLWWAYRIIIERMTRNNISSHEAVKPLKKNLIRILSNPVISFKAKLGYILLCISTKFYIKVRSDSTH
ncbi:Glycosyltransferase involved in cell wall bisynthesis [Dialister histaminiformans]|uniref:Glycosyltransferase involved in cell wall bisynthesis n=1 Tax=Allisonella histaminiformans TaxID=209880 RepID=A0A1G5V9M9_9FIRM|nr:glycosyltransferase [Allisonella histaminiformans]SDA42583.1 Glycosyltransferase involved in cell wall bisynthesis [Allisonella histaminiformans]